MKLIRLRLENFRQHALTDIEFKDGMTAIVGENGSGKTTLLEAIGFVLYGDTRGTRDTIPFHWADTNKYLVRLTFEFDDKQFEVERTKTDAYLKEVVGGRIWASGLTKTAKKCEEVLGLNHEQFNNSFCAEQKALAFLDFKDNRDRQREVARMLGYDRLQIAETVANDRRKVETTRKNELNRNLADPFELERIRAEADAGLVAVRAKAAQIGTSITQLEAQLPAATHLAGEATKWKTISAEMMELRGEARGLKTAMEAASAYVDESTKEVAERNLLEPVMIKASALDIKLAELAKDHALFLVRQQCEKDIAACEQEQLTLEKSITSLDLPDLKAISDRISKAVTAHAEATATVNRQREAWANSKQQAAATKSGSEANLRNAQEALRHATDMAAKGICPECGQEIAKSYDSILAEKNLAIDQAELSADLADKNQIACASKPQELADAELAEVAAKRAHALAQDEHSIAVEKSGRASALTDQLKGCADRMATAKSELLRHSGIYDPAIKTATEAERNALEPQVRRFATLDSALNRLAKATADLAKAKTAFDAAKEKNALLDATRNSLGVKSDAEALAAEQELARLSTDLTLAKQELKSSKEFETMAKRELDAAIARIAEHKKRLKELKEIEHSETLNQTISAEMKALRLALNNELGPALSVRASENLELLTNGRYSQLVLDTAFQPTIIEDETVMKTVISGGEEDVVALALRLALSELIQERQGRPMSLLILDEVFGSLDIDRRQAVLERLTSLKGRFQQILVISHIEEINQVADQCLYVRRNDISKASVVTDVPPEGFAILAD